MAKPGDDEAEEKGAFARASERVKNAASSAARAALDPKKAKSALAFKLLVVGLTLTALAAGFDYFGHDDAIHKMVSGYAREAHYMSFAESVDAWDVTCNKIRAATLERLPAPLRDHLAGAALALGALAFGAGLRIKIKEHHPVHGHVLRDVGRAIAGPGLVGVIVFALLSFHGALIVRRSFANVYRQLDSGQMSASDFRDLFPHYAPWAYKDASTVLWLGAVLATLAIVARVVEPRIERGRVPLEVVRRTSAWAAALSLGYFGIAVLVAAVSYGGALPVVTWPWKVDPGAFLAALVFMSFGMGLDRTGTRMIRREDAAAAAAKAPDEKKRAKK